MNCTHVGCQTTLNPTNSTRNKRHRKTKQTKRGSEANRQLELLGADTDAADCAACEFLPNGGRLHLASFDAGGGVSLMAYDTRVRMGRLLLLSVCVVGCVVGCSWVCSWA